MNSKVLSKKNSLRLPDFNSFFWATKIAPLTFTARNWPNLSHDIIFLSGLLHDATFKSDGIKKDGPEIKIKLDRACWEIGYGHNPYLPKVKELPWAISELTLSPVKKVVWQRSSKKRNKSFLLQHTSIGTRTWTGAEFELVFSGHEDSIHFLFSDSSPTILLRDLKGPSFGTSEGNSK